MSDAENVRQKQRRRYFLHNGRLVEEGYPQVEKIEINYLEEHNSFVGHIEKEVNGLLLLKVRCILSLTV